MSFQFYMAGYLGTTTRAREMVYEEFGPWISSSDNGSIELELDSRNKTIELKFDGLYRNPELDFDWKFYKLAQTFPNETTGEIHLFAPEDNYYHGELRIRNGRIFLREMEDRAKEVHPYRLKGKDQESIIFLTDETYGRLEEMASRLRKG